MKLVVGAATDVGRVREGNEDGYLVDDAIGLVAVADGMGGHRAGEVASATALEALRAAVSSGPAAARAIERRQRGRVREVARPTPTLRGMGTTLTAGTLAAGGTLLVGHVGDSRAYLLRDGDARAASPPTTAWCEELVATAGSPTTRPRCTRSATIITRALGIGRVGRGRRVPGGAAALGDRVLLCSDGLTDMVHDGRDRAPSCAASPTRRAAAHKLVDAANAAGGDDNITVVVVAVTDDDARSRPATLLRPSSPLDARAARSTPRRASSTTSPSPAARRERGTAGCGRPRPA